MIALIVTAILIGPACLVLGFILGANLQYAASRGTAPLKFWPDKKISVVGDDEPVEDPRRTAFRAELDQMDKEQFSDSCDFYAVKFDDRPEAKEGLIAQIIEARFSPGAYRA